MAAFYFGAGAAGSVRRSRFWPRRGGSARARARGEIGSDALERIPMLLLAPGLLVSIWNHMFADEALDPPDVFESYFDLLFGKPGA